MNYYKRHIGDYLKDTSHLSLLEHGIYTRILDVYYTRESAIPETQVARLIGARSKDELSALQRILDEFFVLIDGAYRQGRCDKELLAIISKAEKNREVGKLGGRPPKTEVKKEEIFDKKITMMVSENNQETTQMDIFPNPNETQATNHKPVTNNQLKTKEEASPPPEVNLFTLADQLGVPRSVLGKQIKIGGQSTCASALGQMLAQQVADPVPYFVAATTPKKRGVVV